MNGALAVSNRIPFEPGLEPLVGCAAPTRDKQPLVVMPPQCSSLLVDDSIVDSQRFGEIHEMLLLLGAIALRRDHGRA